MAGIFAPNHEAKKAARKAERLEKERLRKEKARDRQLTQARSDQRDALLGGRSESTQTSILGG